MDRCWLCRKRPATHERRTLIGTKKQVCDTCVPRKGR